MNLNPIALIYKNFHNFCILRDRNLNLAKQSALLLTAVIFLFLLLDLFTLIEIIHQQRSAFMSKLTRFKKIGALFLGIPIYGILYLHLIRYLKIYDKLDKEGVYYLTKKQTYLAWTACGLSFGLVFILPVLRKLLIGF